MTADRTRPHPALALLRAWSDPLEDAIIELSAQQMVTAWSEGAERLFGYDAREALDHPLSQLIALRGSSAELERALDAAVGGAASSGSWPEATTRAGEPIAVRYLVLPGSPQIMLVMRAQAERATLMSRLQAQTARLEIATGMALSQLDAVGSLPKLLFREVAPQLLGPVCDGCMLWLKDEQDPSWLAPVSIHDRDGALERVLRSEGVKIRCADPGAIGRAFRSREPQLLHRNKRVRALSARFSAFRTGAPDSTPHSVCWIPIRARAEPVGLLCAYRRLPGTHLEQDDLRLLNDVACRLLLARSRQRLTAEMRGIEEHFVKSFHGNPAGLLITRLEDSLVIDCNRAFASTLGYERAQVIGRKVSDLGVQQAEQRARVIADLREQGAQRSLELVLNHRTGRPLCVLAAVDLLDLDDEPCLLTMIIDQTERREAERALRMHETMLRETGNIAKVGGWQLDVRTGTGTWTEQVALMHELDPLDPIWRERGIEFYHGDDRERITRALEAAVARAEPYDLEMQIDTAQGHRRWVRTIGQPVFEHGEVVRLRGSMQDITEPKLRELRLRAQLDVSRVLFESESMARAAPQLMRILCELEEWQAAVLWQTQDQDGVVLPAQRWPDGPNLSREHALVERARRSQQLCQLEPARAHTADDALHEVCALPLTAAGEMQGVLQFFASSARALEAGACDALTATAQQIGLFMFRERQPARSRAARASVSPRAK